LRGGDEAAAERLLPLVYSELRALAGAAMKRERPGHTLQPTAVVHEAFLRLVGSDQAAWKDRSHFIGIATRVMRQLLIDHARKRGTERRGGDLQRVSLVDVEQVSDGQDESVDLLALHQALDELAQLDPRQAQIVELRYFGGLTGDETAELLGVSRRTVNGDWLMARAWLHRRLSEGERE
jgi:RNA polymerase sigma factor (TIGR02999 family)